MRHRALKALGLACLLMLGTLVAAQSSAEPAAPEPIGYWTGGKTTDANFLSEPFEAGGTWELTLGAYCFEGIGNVKVILYDADGEMVTELLVLGEGLESVVLETEPGTYHLEVVVSHFHIYTWEILAMPVVAED